MVAKRAIIYCRVSSQQQAEDDKTSLETQEAYCQEACKERGYLVVKVIHEIDKRWQIDRPKLLEARHMIRDRRADIIMASVMDRFTGDQRHYYLLMEDIERHGGEVEFARQNFEDTAVGRFLRGVYVFMGEVETERLQMRVKDGKRGHIMAGHVVGTIPTGFKRVVSEGRKPTEADPVEVDELMAPTVRRIYEGYANEGLALRKLGAVLKAEGHLTLRGKTNWSPSALNGIIENPKNMGVWQGGFWDTIHEKSKKSKTVRRPESEWGPVVEGPAIVTPDLWQRANNRRKNARAESPRRSGNHDKFLLRSGFIKCGLCNNPMYGITISDGDRKYYHYRCDRNTKSACRGVSISAKVLDASAWSIVEDVFESPASVLEWGIAQDEDGSLDERIAETRAEVAAIAVEMAKLSDRLAKVPDYAVAGIVKTLEGHHQRHEERSTTLIELEEQGRQRAKLHEMRDAMVDWGKKGRERLDGMDYQERRDILRAIGMMVSVYPAGHKFRWLTDLRIDPRYLGPNDEWPDDDDWEWIIPASDWTTPLDKQSDSVQKNCALLSATPRA